ncbi:MAG: 3-dehydroquinate synthase [Dehalococcoidales bacterium]|jgi:3-dehydroquinate synthase|nr:3-dehydroquinate synthase [Dehalococcoidales bacterium]
MMRIVQVHTENSYRIYIGSGVIERISEILKENDLSNRAVVITNDVVANLYGPFLMESLNKNGIGADILTVPDGEEQKSLHMAAKLYGHLSRLKSERSTAILALGGGVIGDLAGFVAATYMRGLPLIQIPTTLLAQVDSSIGGKVAVNHRSLKNMIGTFYQPRLVLTDISLLKSLADQEMKNGLAEVIKYGIIRDSELFQILENNLDKIRAHDQAILEEIVARCASIKAGIVQTDERDTGLRNILNFGHTTGHAIETVTRFKISHGQAVALGMIVAAEIAREMDLLSEGEVARIISIIEKAGLATRISELNSASILRAMKHDKKVTSGKIRFILPVAIGEVIINDQVDRRILKKALEVIS